MGKEAERNALKNEVLETVMTLMREHYDADVERTGTSEFMMPGVDKDGNEFYYLVEISIPRGKRNGQGSYIPYNGYDAAEEYKRDQEAKVAEEAAKAAKKEAEAKAKAERKQVKTAIKNLEKAVSG